MEFDKLKNTVINFSTFIVGSSIWLIFTLGSIWIALDLKLLDNAQHLFLTINNILQSQPVIAFIDNYGLKPLFPLILIFLITFILHWHNWFLDTMGRFVPPELVLHYMPGIRDIVPGRWYSVLNDLKNQYTFNDLHTIVAFKYLERKKKKQGPYDYDLVFNKFKTLVAINFICLFYTIFYDGRIMLCLLTLIIFALASCFAAILYVYHERNTSHWIIEEILLQISADDASKNHSGLRIENPDINKKELDEIEQFHKNDNSNRVCTLSWMIPLIGNSMILKESLKVWTRKNNPKGEKPNSSSSEPELMR